MFPYDHIACVSAGVLRSAEVGYVIERRPDEVPEDFHCSHDTHVVAGPATEMSRLEALRRARIIAKHPSTTIIPPAAPIIPSKFARH